MQQWEYKVQLRSRGFVAGKADWDKSIVAMLPELGNDGWELITVITRSSDPTNAGVVTEEQWVFKRPKVTI
jgi:hypothetical protein